MARPVLLYDSECRLCRFAARVVVRLDLERELGVLPLQDPEAASFLEPLTEEERITSWRVVQPDGSLAGLGAGVVPLLRAMRLTGPAARLVSLVPDRALNAAYGVVARHRSRLGRAVPDGPAPRRFP
ncbi:MAG: DCC1-like thiol-disulfide oxidoreductase family protein [Gaiellaceae bacterium]